MIKIIATVILSVFVSTSNAAPNHALCASNEAGGNIILTKSKTKQGETIVVSVSGSGAAIYGTWALIGERTIMVIWENGRSSLFDVSIFRSCKL